MVYDVTEGGGVGNGKIFYDASAVSDPGAPDGMKIHRNGTIYATGPGGVWVFSADGKPLGRIRVGQLCSNVAFDTHQTHLYVTADPWLVRISLRK
jgi:gluconolactonase